VGATPPAAWISLRGRDTRRSPSNLRDKTMQSGRKPSSAWVSERRPAKYSKATKGRSRRAWRQRPDRVHPHVVRPSLGQEHVFSGRRWPPARAGRLSVAPFRVRGGRWRPAAAGPDTRGFAMPRTIVGRGERPSCTCDFTTGGCGRWRGWSTRRRPLVEDACSDRVADPVAPPARPRAHGVRLAPDRRGGRGVSAIARGTPPCTARGPRRGRGVGGVRGRGPVA
jgi:hypothetical protein